MPLAPGLPGRYESICPSMHTPKPPNRRRGSGCDRASQSWRWQKEPADSVCAEGPMGGAQEVQRIPLYHWPLAQALEGPLPAPGTQRGHLQGGDLHPTCPRLSEGEIFPVATFSYYWTYPYLLPDPNRPGLGRIGQGMRGTNSRGSELGTDAVVNGSDSTGFFFFFPSSTGFTNVTSSDNTTVDHQSAPPPTTGHGLIVAGDNSLCRGGRRSRRRRGI